MTRVVMPMSVVVRNWFTKASVTLTDAVADDTILTLCLPQSTRLALRLAHFGETFGPLPSSAINPDTYEGTLVEAAGRSAMSNPIELSEGEPAILGYTILEAMGMRIDAETQSIRILPEPYLRI